MPKLCIEDNTQLEVVEEFKLLGLIFQSNLRWQANTDYMCKKAYARLWMLRGLVLAVLECYMYFTHRLGVYFSWQSLSGYLD